MEKNKIQFKPLHEGMGFHPFSDGLPYAPESKAKTANTSRSAAGASAAGRPRFHSAHAATPATTGNPGSSLPLRTARQLQSAPVASPTAPHRSTPHRSSAQRSPTHGSAAPLNLRPQAVSRPAAPQAVPANRTEPSPEVLLRTRAFAYLLDSVVHAGFWLATNIAALLLFHFQIDLEILRENTAQFVGFFVFSQWIFIALQEVMFGNSIGKAFFELEFKRNHRSLFLRSVVFMFGLLAFGLGLRYRLQDRLGEIQLRQITEG